MFDFISTTLITLMEPVIIYLILIPLIGVLVILFTNFDKIKKLTLITPLIIKQNSDTVLYNIALFFSLFNLLVSVFMWYLFNNGSYGAEHLELGEAVELGAVAVGLGSPSTQFQFIFEINHFSFGVDGISIFFVLLTTFITPIAIFSSYELYVSAPGAASTEQAEVGATQLRSSATTLAGASKTNNGSDIINLKIFLISLLLLESLQICAFVSLDLLLFYIFFESVLPVLFILIVVFGHGENRFRSAFLLFLYTLAGSLPMLLSILTIYSYLDSTDYQLISFNEISLESQKWLWVLVPFSKENLPNRDLNKISSTITASIHTAADNLKTGKFIKLNRKNWLPENKECKSLVIYGTNISSTVNYIYFNRIVRQMVKNQII